MFRPSKELCQCGREKSQVAKTCFECRKKRIKRICKQCNREYECKPSINKIYCSRKCRYADTKTNKEMHQKQSRREIYNCRQCGKQCDVEASRARGKFCNSECAYKFNRGENHSQWKGGITPERQKFSESKEWKDCTKFVFKRDNATCRKCTFKNKNEQRKKFHIHHVISFRHKQHRTDANNLVLLCEECHRWVHSNQNTNREFISELD